MKNTDSNELDYKLGAPLQVEITGLTKRIESELLGVFPNRCLMIRLPESRAFFFHERSRIGSKVIVRYIHDGYVFGFNAKLLDTLFVPAKILFITYPKTVEKFNLRASPRFQCMLPATFNFKDRSYSGIILDISEGGCRYLIKASEDRSLPLIEINQRAMIHFRLPGASEKHITFTLIKNMHIDFDELRLGLQFIDVPDSVRSAVATYISEIADNMAIDMPVSRELPPAAPREKIAAASSKRAFITPPLEGKPVKGRPPEPKEIRVREEAEPQLDDRDSFKAAYDEIGQGGGFVSIARLREKLGWPPDQFETVLLQLMADYTIELMSRDPAHMGQDSSEAGESPVDEDQTITIGWRADE